MESVAVATVSDIEEVIPVVVLPLLPEREAWEATSAEYSVIEMYETFVEVVRGAVEEDDEVPRAEERADEAEDDMAESTLWPISVTEEEEEEEEEEINMPRVPPGTRRSTSTAKGAAEGEGEGEGRGMGVILEGLAVGEMPRETESEAEFESLLQRVRVDVPEAVKVRSELKVR